MVFADRGLEIEETSGTGRRLRNQQEANPARSIFPPGTNEICRIGFRLTSEWCRDQFSLNSTAELFYLRKSLQATVLSVPEPKAKKARAGREERLSTFHGLKEGDETEVEVTEISRDGRGLGRLNGLLVFVSGASPGEKVKVRIVKLGVRHAEAEVIKSQRMATASARA